MNPFMKTALEAVLAVNFMPSNNIMFSTMQSSFDAYRTISCNEMNQELILLIALTLRTLRLNVHGSFFFSSSNSSHTRCRPQARQSNRHNVLIA